MEGFKEYCTFNGITEDVIKSAIPLMKYEKIKEGEYLIKKEEKWTKFYFILRGRITVKFRDDNSDIKKKNLFISR